MKQLARPRSLYTSPRRAHLLQMTTSPKPYVKPQPLTKDQLRQMLAQAVRNTQPELNNDVQAPETKAKRKSRSQS
ncbi:hypothetical protein [Bradyrhizobium sp. OK095]|uniref:hypothetical protein n=1 Tax=Bradyrhizobium sp. OK095 TaxID=1882760 RepID=UPI0008D4AC14|nr:hypothetical protein [Bradyrhizobium sp. OK095]SEN59292.1 hypothetical protein SAMN05443254_109265 [Bradyrhizobium sp. OK095]